MEITTETLLELSKQYGDAFYILDSKQFEDNYINLKNSFCNQYDNFNIAYSYKTNYIPKLCKIVKNYGGYAEVVSEMELELALRIGVEPANIIWNGPIKQLQNVENLLIAGGTVNIDSDIEMENILCIAEKYPDKKINVGIRCNFDVGDGVLSRFGIDVDSISFEKIIQIFKENRNLNLINLQCHFAKRNVEFWPTRAEKMLQVTDKVEGIIGYIPERLDLGGGLFGNMPDSLKQQFHCFIPTYTDYANAVVAAFNSHFPNKKPELVIEPGSALAADSMKFVARVKSIKTVRDKTFATVLGSQKNISMTGVNPPMEIYAVDNYETLYSDVDIVGYTCIESDILYKNYTGTLGLGDFAVFSNCGSYSVVMKPPFILPNFPVLEIRGDTVELIKRGESFDDLFHTFVF